MSIKQIIGYLQRKNTREEDVYTTTKRQKKSHDGLSSFSEMTKSYNSTQPAMNVSMKTRTLVQNVRSHTTAQKRNVTFSVCSLPVGYMKIAHVIRSVNRCSKKNKGKGKVKKVVKWEATLGYIRQTYPSNMPHH